MIYEDVPFAVCSAITRCLYYGLEVESRGHRCYELRNVVLEVMNPQSGPITCADEEHNCRMERYYAAEVSLYDRHENRAAEYAKYAKLWAEIANPDGTINSCYGKLIRGDKRARSAWHVDEDMTQWEWAKRSLMADHGTRQAFIRVGRDDHQWWGNKDLPCTMHLLFDIRNCRLNLTAVMRSNDVTRGLPYDAPYFVLLQERMLAELQPVYPRLVMGTYTHIAHSLHLYHSEVSKARRMIGADNESAVLP